MGWPTGTIDTTNIDADTDDPALGVLDIKIMADKCNTMIAGRGTTDGVASLDSSGLLTNAQLPATISQTSVTGTTVNAGTTLQIGGVATTASASDLSITTNSVANDSFFPTLLDDSLNDSESQTYISREGSYTRVGDIVFFTIEIEMLSLGLLTTSHGAKIGGLPVSAVGNSAISVGFANNLAITAGYSVQAYVQTGSQYIVLQLTDTAAGYTPLTIAQLSDDGVIWCAGHYFV